MQWGETKTDDDDDAHLLKNICMWEQGGRMWVELCEGLWCNQYDRGKNGNETKL